MEVCLKVNIKKLSIKIHKRKSSLTEKRSRLCMNYGFYPKVFDLVNNINKYGSLKSDFA